MITQEELHRLFHYDELTGNFIRRITTASVAIKGQIAGCLDNSSGYIYININRKKYPVHKLVYLYLKGYEPPYVDHIDGDRTNNKLSNLRECTQSQNRFNSKRMSNNTSGVKGVSYSKRFPHYRAAIVDSHGIRHRKIFSVSIYGSKEAALEAAKKWIEPLREQLHREFTHHG